MRVQALESMLNNFKARQTECVHGKGMPGKYVIVEMWDQYAGLGNQFPSMITGDDHGHVLSDDLQPANVKDALRGDRQHHAPPLNANLVQWLPYKTTVVATLVLSAGMPVSVWYR